MSPKQRRPKKKNQTDAQSTPQPASTQRRASQPTVSNAARQRQAQKQTRQVTPDTEATIDAQRGGGQTVDPQVARKVGNVTGHDVSHARIHTDETADRLSRQLNARAFTVGNDIFFRSGEYGTESDAGQSLLSHELAHVAQQSGDGAALAQRTEIEEEDLAAQREADLDDEELLELKPADAQLEEMPEGEELLELKPAAAQREEMPADEELLDLKRDDLQRETALELDDEDLQLKRTSSPSRGQR